jgi:hypothetical protein
MYKLLKERERSVSVFSAESQTPPPELDVVMGQGENPELLLVEEKQPPLAMAKSTKHVMPPSSLKMEKEVAGKTSASKPAPKPASKPASKPKPVALSMFKEPAKQVEQVEQEVADVAAAAAALVPPPPPSSTKPPKKQRQKGIAVPKLNLNPVEEDTPSQPLLLPTFQAKGKGKSSLTKIKPISVSSPAGPAVLQQQEQQQEEEQGEE